VDLLAAVPSVIYGLWGFTVLRPHVEPIQNWLAGTFGWIPLFADGQVTGTIFLASIVLTIMILHHHHRDQREVFAKTRPAHRGRLGPGRHRWEMIRTAVIPFGRAGVISAAMLGLGRALGETIAVTSSSARCAVTSSLSLFTVARPSHPRSPIMPPSSTARRRPGVRGRGLVLLR
jgi:phosphate transport system permease protein